MVVQLIFVDRFLLGVYDRVCFLLVQDWYTVTFVMLYEDDRSHY
mgnify:CR=1 FL=1